MTENKEKGIIINGIDVFACNNIIFEHYDGFRKRTNVCECGLYEMEGYDTMCADNPDCYYKQLQREKQKNKELIEDFNEIRKRHNEAFEDFKKLKQTNEKLRKTLKEIEEIAKTKIYTPICFEDPDCHKNGGVGIDNDCEKYCPILTIEKILEKIKEVENDNSI